MFRTALAVFATLSAGQAAQAQTVDGQLQEVQIVGEAPVACVVVAAPTTSGDNAVFASTSSRGAEVAITQFVDPQTAQVRPTRISLALPVICNTGHRVIVRTVNGGLAREGSSVPPQSGFRALVPYSLSANWAGLNTSAISSAGGALTINRTEGASGDLGLQIQVPEGGDPLIAGTYSDQVIIELQVAT